MFTRTGRANGTLYRYPRNTCARSSLQTKLGIGVSLSELLVLRIDKEARKENLKRSALVEKALEQYLNASEEKSP